MKILIINCGSSSLKYKLIDMANEKDIIEGIIERIGLDQSRLVQKNELREKYIMDQKAIEYAGYYKGIKAGKIGVARKLLQQGIAIEVISQATGLPKEEIEKL